MAAVNGKRIVVGGLLGGLAWNVWSILVNAGLLAKLYQEEEAAGHLLPQPRYGFFMGLWILTLFLLGIGLAWIYAASRGTLGPGPLSALKVGLVAGLLAGWPGNLAQASWSPVSRWLPLGWMADLVVGCALATLVAGWYYRD
jgi:hypothetical protein